MNADALQHREENGCKGEWAVITGRKKILNHHREVRLHKIPINYWCVLVAWLNIIPTVVNGMSLPKEEFRDGLRMRYGIELDNLPKKFDGYGAKFSVGHVLACKNGGLVVVRYDELKDELACLATLATSSNRVRNEPIIKIDCDTTRTGVPAHVHIDSSKSKCPHRQGV